MGASVFVELILKYYFWLFDNLIDMEILCGKQCMVGSLTGVVASQNVTEAFKGTLSTLGNRTQSAIA